MHGAAARIIFSEWMSETNSATGGASVHAVGPRGATGAGAQPTHPTYRRPAGESESPNSNTNSPPTPRTGGPQAP